jgi:hypothetical protein
MLTRTKLVDFSVVTALLSLYSAKVKVRVTLRLTVSQSVSLGVEPHQGLHCRHLCTDPLRSNGRYPSIVALLGRCLAML